MKYELIKDGKKIYVSRELQGIKRMMAKEILGLSDRQAFDPAFEPEDYKFNKLYPPYIGRSIMLTKIDDGEISTAAVSDEDDTLPWFIINATNIDRTTDRPVAQSQKKEKIIKKLHSLNVWVDSFELDKVYESENKVFFKVTQQDEKHGARTQVPHERKVKPRKETHTQKKPNVFVSRRGYSKTASKSKSSDIPEVIVKSLEKALTGKPFFLSQLKIEGREVAPFTDTSRTRSAVFDAIKQSFGTINYWILHDGNISFFRKDDKWYHVGDSSYPVGTLFKTLLKSEEFSV